MDLGKIFNTYTNSSNINERNNVLTEITPHTPEESSAINYFYTQANDIKEELVVDNESNDTLSTTPVPEEVTPSLSELEEDLLDAFSDLDEQEESPLTSEADKEDNIDSTYQEDNFDKLLNEDNNLSIQENEESEVLNDDDLASFINELNEADNNIDTEDLDNIIFNEEYPNPDLDDSDIEFEIEHPDDLFTREIEKEANNFSTEEELPDFSKIESLPKEQTTTEFLDPQKLEPTKYEHINNSESFDAWKNIHKKQDENISDFSLTEEQMFIIRENINALNNKDLRFELRNILLEPHLHQEYFNELVSLLLMNSQEQVLQNFLDKYLPKIDNKLIINSIDSTDSRASFFADDFVALEQMKENFAEAFQKISLYTLITLLFGTILWTGFAQPFRANSLFKKGLIAIQKDRYTEGESLFNQATQIAGRPILKWYIKYGDTYSNKSLINIAEQKYKSALAIVPNDIKTGIHVSDFYTNLGITYYPKAINIMERLSKIHPKEFQVWDYYGALYINCAEAITNDRVKQIDLYYKATDIYKEFILNNINNSAPYYKMIDIYIKIGNNEQINKITNLITQLDPKYLNIEVLTELASYYTDRHKLNDSERIFRRLVPFLDQHVNNLPKLQKLLFKEYNINPSKISNILSDSYYELARYKMLSTDIKGAASLLTNSLIFNSQNYKGYNLLGEVYLSSHGIPNRLNKANSLFKQSLEINPNNYKAYKNTGHIYYYWDQEVPNPENAHNTALYNYRMAKVFIPDHKKDYLLSYNLGWLEYNNNNPKEALNLWSDIYKEDPSNPALAYALGVALYQTENPRLAQVELTKVANTFKVIKDNINIPNLKNKRHKEIYTQLARICNNIGVINANYGLANPSRRNSLESEALVNFYNAKDISDQLNSIYSISEYNIGVLTRPNIKNRHTKFDNTIPKQTTLNNLHSEFKTFLLEDI